MGAAGIFHGFPVKMPKTSSSTEEKLQALCRKIYDDAPSWCFMNGRSRGDMCSEPEYGNALQAIEKLFEELGLELLPRPGPRTEEY